jgi:hypothetical protein
MPAIGVGWNVVIGLEHASNRNQVGRCVQSGMACRHVAAQALLNFTKEVLLSTWVFGSFLHRS